MTIDDRAFDHLSGLVAEDNAPLELVIDGRYEVTGRLARGGMGEVFTARDHRLGRDVAMKVLAAELSSPEWVERFRAEARTMTRIDHPGVVPIHDLGLLPDGRAYYTMKLVEGRTLDRVIAQTRDRRLLVRVLVQVCAVVQQAHDRGIVHRDLKPANIMVGQNEQVFVLDWGIARVVDDLRIEGGGGVERGTGRTATGLVLGTLQYMAPEQARGEIDAIDERSDVYALGGILYSMVTGRPPRAAAETALLLEKASTGAIVPPRRKDPTIPAEIEAVCLKALSPGSAARYSSARELADDLRRWLEGDPVLARRPSPLYRLWRAAAKRKALSIASSLTVLVTASFAIYWLAHREDRAHAEAKRREDEVFGPLRQKIGLLNRTHDGWKEASRLMASGLERVQDSWDGWMQKGRYDDLAGDYDAALAAYSKASELNPGLSAAHYRRGKIYLDVMGRREDALAAFEAARRADPGNDFATLGRARVASLNGDFVEALELCRKIEPHGGGMADLQFLLGFLHGRPELKSVRDPDRSIAYYDKALRIDPTDPYALSNRSAMKADKKDFDGAIADASRAIEIQADFAGAFSNRALASRGKGDLQAALRDFTRAIELDRNDSTSVYFRGEVRMNLGDADGALADFTRVIEREPSKAGAFGNRGVLRAQKGEVDGAIEDFTRAIALDPRSAEAYHNRGRAWRMKGDRANAVSDATRSIELDPGAADVWALRGHARLETGDLAGAIGDFTKAIERGSGQAGRVYYNRAGARSMSGDREGALADLESALRTMKEDDADRAVVEKKIQDLKKP